MFNTEYARKGVTDQFKFLMRIVNDNRLHIDTVYDNGRIDQEDFDEWRRINNSLIILFKDTIEDIGYDPK